MRVLLSLLAIGLAAAWSAGCTPPPPRIQVPDQTHGNPYTTREHDPEKPLPPSATHQSMQSPQPISAAQPPSSPPAVSQAYLDAYDRVGRPRLLVLIERPSQIEPSLVPGDYDLLERLVREFLSAGGQVAVVGPNTIHERLSDQQIRDILAGQSAALVDAGAAIHADVVIDLRIASAGDQVELTANARNTRDNVQLATASTSIASSSARPQIDFAGRLLGERMVDALAGAWDRLSRQSPTTQPRTP